MELRDQLRSSKPVIAPSMLKCDFGDLRSEVQALEAAGADILHMDVMDGHFVPNLSYGAMVIADVRRLTDLPLEAHLMISEPARYVDEYIDAGCQLITVHIEAEGDPSAVLARIRDADVLAGISLNPDTPPEALEPVVGQADVVLVMSVNPGFGGQKFMPECLSKTSKVREMFGTDVLLSIDGGIGTETIGDSAAAGCELFVVGSAIFERPDYAAAISELRHTARRQESTTESN